MTKPIQPDPTAKAQVLRTWLMRNPRPKSIRVYSNDGREYDIPVKAGINWTEAATSILALNPDRVEVSDEDKLLRACAIADLIAKEEKQQAQAAAVSAAMTATDPETQRLIVFAELLQRSSDRAIEAIERTAGAAFDRMQGICDFLGTQATAATQSANELTVAVRNLLVQQAQEAVENANEKEQSPLEEMAANFLSGQKMAEAERAQQPNGKPNGNGNGKGH
jgi:hypothetical protein